MTAFESFKRNIFYSRPTITEKGRILWAYSQASISVSMPITNKKATKKEMVLAKEEVIEQILNLYEIVIKEYKENKDGSNKEIKSKS